MKAEETKNVAGALNELSASYSELLRAMTGTAKELETAKKLWNDGNKSRLIKIGLALIVLPEPTPISETVGACFVAAGLVQKGIRTRTIYIEDVYKTFQNTLKEVMTAKNPRV